jgi:AcrR family transcriptional regulator
MTVVEKERIDPRVIRTRQLLIDAFLGLQAEKDFDDITIQDITTRATVNRATFYAHFPDKYALVNDIMRGNFEQVLESRLGPELDIGHNYLSNLLLAVTDHLTMLQTRCQRSFLMFESLVEAQTKLQLRQRLIDWLQARPHTSGLPIERVEMAATVLSWAMYGAANEWRGRADAQSADAFVKENLPMLIAMVEAL